MPTKRTTQTAATRPMTGAEAFEAGRRAYEAAAAGSTGAAAPTAAPQRAPVTTRPAKLRYGVLNLPAGVADCLLVALLVILNHQIKDRGDVYVLGRSGEALALLHVLAGHLRDLSLRLGEFLSASANCQSRMTDMVVGIHDRGAVTALALVSEKLVTDDRAFLQDPLHSPLLLSL